VAACGTDVEGRWFNQTILPRRIAVKDRSPPDASDPVSEPKMIEPLVAYVYQAVQQTSSLPLTDRQVEILTLLALGLSEKEVAVRLGISLRTARNHVANMYERLGLHHRTDAVLAAVRYGLVKV